MFYDPEGNLFPMYQVSMKSPHSSLAETLAAVALKERDGLDPLPP